MGELWITQKGLESFENEIAALTKERDELQIQLLTAMKLTTRRMIEAEQLAKERDELLKVQTHLRECVANPPPDVQERVIQMLNLVHADAVTKVEKERDELKERVRLLLQVRDDTRARAERSESSLAETTINHLKLRVIYEEYKARSERAESAVHEWENREASVCPENTSFEKVIYNSIRRYERAEAKYASLFACFDTMVCLILEDANSNMLRLRSGKTNIGISSGLADFTTEIKKEMQDMQAFSGSTASSGRSELQETQIGIMEGSQGKESREVHPILSGLQEEASRKECAGLCKEKSVQSSLQNNASECSFGGEDCKAEAMSKVWMGGSTTRPSRRLQQAIECSLGLQNLSREIASEILNALSTDCGKGYLPPDKVQRLKEAMRQIEKVDYSAAATNGAAYTMHKIAKETLSEIGGEQ